MFFNYGINMSVEIWKDINGYEGYYQISNYGMVKSLVRKNRIKEKILIQKINNGGYLFVILYKNNIPKTFDVHRLVLEAFVGRCPQDMESRHLDGNKSNNHTDNLTYSTHKINVGDKIIHGTSNCGSRHGKAKLNEKQVRIIKWLLKDNELTIKEIAIIFDISYSTVYRIKNNKTWIHLLKE